jgi:hypothetical protein
LDTFFPLSQGEKVARFSRPLCVPKQQLEIKSEFVYNQNLQLFISAAAKKK